MATKLTFYHARTLFKGSSYKPWLAKWFGEFEYLGCETGNFYPSIMVSNYEDVKDKLPKSYQPIKTEMV